MKDLRDIRTEIQVLLIDLQWMLKLLLEVLHLVEYQH